jgi:hypothetical protein
MQATSNRVFEVIRYIEKEKARKKFSECMLKQPIEEWGSKTAKVGCNDMIHTKQSKVIKYESKVLNKTFANEHSGAMFY